MKAALGFLRWVGEQARLSCVSSIPPAGLTGDMGCRHFTQEKIRSFHLCQVSPDPQATHHCLTHLLPAPWQWCVALGSLCPPSPGRMYLEAQLGFHGSLRMTTS